MKRVLFYYPTRSIGGAQLLFARTAKFLVEHTDEEVFYVDYADGFSAGILRGSDVKLIVYQDEEKTELPEDCVAVLHLGYINQVKDVFKLTSGNRFFFWSIHPGNLTGKVIAPRLGLIAPLKKCRRIGDIVVKLCQNGMLRFMAYSNYIAAARVYKFDTQVEYLPIFIEDEFVKKDVVFSREKDRPLSFLWLSRLDEDKVYTCVAMLNELERLSSRYNVQMYVIGGGTHEHIINGICNQYSYKVSFEGRISGKELDAFVDEKVDVGIGMGTSMLEIAKRGKPVIFKSCVSKKESNNQYHDYVFLHEEFDYSLDTPEKSVEGMGSMEDKIKQLLDNYTDIAQKDYEYLCYNHLQSSVCRQLESAIENVRQMDQKVHFALLGEITHEFEAIPFRKYILKPLKSLKLI